MTFAGGLERDHGLKQIPNGQIAIITAFLDASLFPLPDTLA